MVSRNSGLADASAPYHGTAKPSMPDNLAESPQPSTGGLLEAVKLRPSHSRNQSDSDISTQSSGFDDERPSQDNDDIDNTPATSFGGFLSTASEASAGPKSDSSHLSNVVLLSSALSVASEDPDRMGELKQEVEALFDKFLPDFQVKQDRDPQHGAEPTLLSRNLPAILSEFEKQRDHPLIDPKVFSQLEVFTEENPEVPISSNMLVNLIHALESSAQSICSEDLHPKSPSLMDREMSHSTANDSTPIAASDELADLSQDEHLIRDTLSRSESSKELSPEAAIILDLKEDLRMERDKNEALQQTLSDKERRVHALEHKHTTAQEQYEETILEAQARIEELHKEIQALRRDDKESRIKHHELQEQNNAYESQLTALNTQLDASEKAFIKVRRDLEEESSHLIKAKADLDRKVKEMKELSEYLVECEQAKSNAEKAQNFLSRELEKVRIEADKLQGYKEETEELRSTVDKLELELDEVRRLTSLHSKETSMQQQHSNPGTLSRRLGNEIARSMDLDGHSSDEDTQVEDKDADTSNMDDFIETVIQRRRRRVGKARKSVEMVTQSIQTDLYEENAVTEPFVETMAESMPPNVSSTPRIRIATESLPALFRSFPTALTARTTSLVVMLLAIGLALGLLLNTSRDIYHIHHQSLDADEFRKLNYLPSTAQNYYYDGRYPNAVVGANFIDDYIGPVLDAMLSLIGFCNPSRAVPSGIVY